MLNLYTVTLSHDDVTMLMLAPSIRRFREIAVELTNVGVLE